MGKMQLEGESIKLKKPLVVMSLHKGSDGTSEYHTKGVVRQKLVFKSRPVPAARPAVLTSAGSNKRTRADEPSSCSS